MNYRKRPVVSQLLIGRVYFPPSVTACIEMTSGDEHASSFTCLVLFVFLASSSSLPFLFERMVAVFPPRSCNTFLILLLKRFRNVLLYELMLAYQERDLVFFRRYWMPISCFSSFKQVKYRLYQTGKHRELAKRKIDAKGILDICVL